MPIRQISVRLEKGIRKVHCILHACLGVSKVSARWMPRLLEPEQKLSICRQLQELLVMRYVDEFWQQIITTDETWNPYFNPETKSQPKEWRKPEEGPPLKARAVPSVELFSWIIYRKVLQITSSRQSGLRPGTDPGETLAKGCQLSTWKQVDHRQPAPQSLQQQQQQITQNISRATATDTCQNRLGKLHKRLLLQQSNTRQHTARKTNDVSKD